MGTGPSNCEEDSVEIEYVGRDKEFERVKLLLNKQNVIGIYGVRKIGKSRFVAELFRRMCDDADTLCMFKDFEMNDITSPYNIHKLVHDITTQTGMDVSGTNVVGNYPEENLTRGLCSTCLYDGIYECKTESVEQTMSNLTTNLQCFNKRIVLFLDNVDNVLLESDLKEHFLRFIDATNEKCSNTNLIFCSRNKVNIIHDSLESIALGPLAIKTIIKIIYLTTEDVNGPTCELILDEEQIEDTCFSEQVPQTNLFKEENEYFTPENREFMEEIASLCNGYPAVAILSGNLLIEDDGLLTPAELTHLLKEIKAKVDGLGYELSIDKSGDCESPMQQLELLFSEILYEEDNKE